MVYFPLPGAASLKLAFKEVQEDQKGSRSSERFKRSRGSGDPRSSEKFKRIKGFRRFRGFTRRFNGSGDSEV